MATVTLDGVNKVYENGFHAIHDLSLEIEDERVPRARRAVRMRQVDGVADDRRAGVDLRRRDEDRRPGRQRRRAEGPGHRHGVPELRAVPAHDGVRQHRLRPQAGSCPQGRDRHAGCARRRRSSSSSRTSTASRASCPAASASGWRWAGRSCASRPRSSWTSRCPTSTPSCACRCAPRSPACSATSAVTTFYVTHDQVEAMTMGDRVAVHQGRLPAAGRHAAEPVRLARQRVRRRLHRFAVDEPLRRHDARRRGWRRR